MRMPFSAGLAASSTRDVSAARGSLRLGMPACETFTSDRSSALSRGSRYASAVVPHPDNAREESENGGSDSGPGKPNDLR